LLKQRLNRLSLLTAARAVANWREQLCGPKKLVLHERMEARQARLTMKLAKHCRRSQEISMSTMRRSVARWRVNLIRRVWALFHANYLALWYNPRRVVYERNGVRGVSMGVVAEYEAYRNDKRSDKLRKQAETDSRSIAIANSLRVICRRIVEKPIRDLRSFIRQWHLASLKGNVLRVTKDYLEMREMRKRERKQLMKDLKMQKEEGDEHVAKARQQQLKAVQEAEAQAKSTEQLAKRAQASQILKVAIRKPVPLHARAFSNWRLSASDSRLHIATQAVQKVYDTNERIVREIQTEMQAELLEKLKVTGLKSMKKILLTWQQGSLRGALTDLTFAYSRHLKEQKARTLLKAKKLKFKQKEDEKQMQEKVGEEVTP